MRILMFLYLLFTLGASVRMMSDGAVWGSVALLIGSLLGFSGGSGTRGAFYRGQNLSGIALGIAFVTAGLSVAYFFDAVLRIFGSAISGELWVLLGALFGFLGARREDAGVWQVPKGPENDMALGTIAPIAAGVAAGRLSHQQAEKLIKDSECIAPGASALWQSMTIKERDKLGLDFMKLAIDPEFTARIEKHLAPLQESDPDLWEQSMAQAREELGRPQKG